MRHMLPSLRKGAYPDYEFHWKFEQQKYTCKFFKQLDVKMSKGRTQRRPWILEGMVGRWQDCEDFLIFVPRHVLRELEMLSTRNQRNPKIAIILCGFHIITIFLVNRLAKELLNCFAILVKARKRLLAVNRIFLAFSAVQRPSRALSDSHY